MDLKVQRILALIEDNDPTWKTLFIESFDCIKRLEDFKAITTLLMPFNPGVQVGADLVNPLVGGVAIGKVVTTPATGTAYALTNTQAALDFGTTDPVIVLDEPGTYLIRAQVHLAYAGATVVAETATLKVRRTNNTAADLSVLPVIDLPVATTLTNSYGIVTIPEFVYKTPRSDDSVTIFGAVSAALGAGAINATAIGTSILAERISDVTA